MDFTFSCPRDRRPSPPGKKHSVWGKALRHRTPAGPATSFGAGARNSWSPMPESLHQVRGVPAVCKLLASVAVFSSRAVAAWAASHPAHRVSWAGKGAASPAAQWTRAATASPSRHAAQSQRLLAAAACRTLLWAHQGQSGQDLCPAETIVCGDPARELPSMSKRNESSGGIMAQLRKGPATWEAVRRVLRGPPEKGPRAHT